MFCRSLDTPYAGLRNEGTLSDYQLTPSLRKAEGWNDDWVGGTRENAGLDCHTE